MIEAKHTPGPWQAVNHHLTVKDQAGEIICHVRSGDHLSADARLIAVAPEMLSTLKDFFGAGEDVVKAGGGAPTKWNYSALQDAWQAARDLIAKAEGCRADPPHGVMIERRQRRRA